MGGANPLTSKVAVVRPSTREGIDVDYLLLQVFVDRPVVTDQQNCGNIRADAGPARELTVIPEGDEKSLAVEHPSGHLGNMRPCAAAESSRRQVQRTARKFYDGVVFARS